MAKSRSTAFFCKECGYETSKWMGQCPGCGQWNTLVEAPVESSVKKGISVLTGWAGCSRKSVPDRY